MLQTQRFCLSAGLALSMLLGLGLSSVFAQTGSISGVVKSKDSGAALSGANVAIAGTNMGAATDANGRFTIANVPAGNYKLRVTFIGYQELRMNVKVTAGETATADFTLRETGVRAGEILVIGASRHRERVVEAPAAVTALTTQILQHETISGQVPTLLETTPGVDVATTNMFDINLNTRGFNSSLNRRVLILVDGRELNIPFIGAMRWDMFSVPTEDLGSVEIVRGPGSALFGANAYSGVLNITTPSPAAIAGTTISVSGGELSMIRGDVRHAGVAGDWAYKINAGRAQTESFAKSRTTSVEYPGLPMERAARDDGEVTSLYGSARLDRSLGSNRYLTFEGGATKTENEVFVTGIGRVQVLEDVLPWGRVNLASDRFFVQMTGGGRSTDKQTALATGANLRENSSTFQGEFQHNTTFNLGGKNLRLVWGASHRLQNIDTKNTLSLGKADENFSGVYAHLQLALSEKLSLIGASRFDRSTLHDSEFSPKAGVVFSPTRDHSFRATYNRAFQSASYAEYFLSAVAGAPVNLTSLGLGVVSILAKGNSNLEVEKVTSFELGYKGILGNRVFLTIDAYRSDLKNFITDLLPGVNQKEFPTTALSPQQQAAFNTVPQLAPLRPLLPGLTKVNGANAFVFSYTNAGDVDEQGLELGINYYVTKEWLIDANATWFDFKVKSQQLGDKLLPNTPDKKFNVGVAYSGRKLYGSLKWRHVPSFDWAAGSFVGRIKKFDIFNASLGYQVNGNFRVGVNALNLTNKEHYEIFGGSVLGRRVLGNVQATF